MGKERREFSPEFKMQVVLESFKINASLNQIAQKYTISLQNIHQWREHFIQNAHLAFQANTSCEKREILEKANEKLEKELFKLTNEYKKALDKIRKADISLKKEMIDTASLELSIVQQCKIIELNRPSLYYVPKPKQKKDDVIMQRMSEILQSEESYLGYRKMHQQLLKEGYKIGVNKVHKLLKILQTKQESTSSHSSEEPPVYLSILHDLELAKPFKL